MQQGIYEYVTGLLDSPKLILHRHIDMARTKSINNGRHDTKTIMCHITEELHNDVEFITLKWDESVSRKLIHMRYWPSSVTQSPNCRPNEEQCEEHNRHTDE